jgi:spoIIIJ-associated protein
MIKIEAKTLEGAYSEAAHSLECSVTELKIEVVQYPSSGFLGLFSKTAIIVAAKNKTIESTETPSTALASKAEDIKENTKDIKKKSDTQKVEKEQSPRILNDTIMPESFVSTQDEEDEEEDNISYLADYDDEFDNDDLKSTQQIAITVQEDINKLFNSICFKIDEIAVSVFDENTLLIEFKGEDAALLIGKEGYRYKALSYMIFNWINTKYQLQLRLEIAEFLKNQEESVSRYLSGVRESVERDGRAQTKVLDGVLVQIALRELRDTYPDKYVAIRSTRDGLKYIIINDYHNS